MPLLVEKLFLSKMTSVSMISQLEQLSWTVSQFDIRLSVDDGILRCEHLLTLHFNVFVIKTTLLIQTNRPHNIRVMPG